MEEVSNNYNIEKEKIWKQFLQRISQIRKDFFAKLSVIRSQNDQKKIEDVKNKINNI